MMRQMCVPKPHIGDYQTHRRKNQRRICVPAAKRMTMEHLVIEGGKKRQGKRQDQPCQDWTKYLRVKRRPCNTAIAAKTDKQCGPLNVGFSRRHNSPFAAQVFRYLRDIF